MAEPPPFTELVHSDWSVAPNKRWVARAIWREGWTITAIEPVGPIPEFLTGLIERATTTATLAGFDFPIGVPAAYGAQTGLSGFPELLHAIGQGRWARFTEVARDPTDISVERPFYPAGASAGIKQADLISAHGVSDLDGLRRACERKTDDRRAACPLFWTLGGNQVGRAALSGWSEVLRPALGTGAKLWPFDGTMADLGSMPGLVLAETYPAEAYGHVGVSFSPRQSKTSQSDRQSKSDALFAWANARRVKLAPEVAKTILDGFGSDKAGEDRFDALLGLTGMIEVASGWRAEGANSRPSAWEGWILGQSDVPASTFPATTPTSPVSPFAPDRSAYDLHRARAIWEGEPDPETDTLPSSEDMTADFHRDGFLAMGVAIDIPNIRSENADLFLLAEDTNRALQAATIEGAATMRGSPLDPTTLAARLALRSSQTFQGVILMAERGMVTEALTLARSLIENAFCVAALVTDASAFIDILKADAEAARREQGRFLVAEGMLGGDPKSEAKLRAAIDRIGKDPKFMSPKQIAKLGPLVRQYLAYQRLSNDAAHPSLSSLHRHIETDVDRTGWHYRWGPGKKEEIAFALQQALAAALGIGVGFTELIEATAQNEAFGPLLERFDHVEKLHGSVIAASKR